MIKESNIMKEIHRVREEFYRETKGEKQVPEESYLGYVQPYLTVPDKVSFGKWNEDMMFYDTNKLELKPEETPPFRSPLNPEMKGGEASRLVLSQREKWKQAQEELKKQAGMGRPITTATEKVSEFEKDDEWVVSPANEGEGAILGNSFTDFLKNWTGVNLGCLKGW